MLGDRYRHPLKAEMSNASVHYAVRDGYAEITLNRPDSLNSFTAEMHAGLRDSFERAPAEGARAILVTGAGRGFCAGQDLTERKMPAPGEAIDLRVFLRERYNPLIKRMRELPLPIVVAVNGVAAGAGMGFALAGDIDILLTVSAPDHDALSETIPHSIRNMPGVASTRSYMILEERAGTAPELATDAWQL